MIVPKTNRIITMMIANQYNQITTMLADGDRSRNARTTWSRPARGGPPPRALAPS